jgi:hypothetical protein
VDPYEFFSSFEDDAKLNKNGVFKIFTKDDISVLLIRVLDYILNHASSHDQAFTTSMWVENFSELSFQGSLSTWTEVEIPRIRKTYLLFSRRWCPPIFLKIKLQKDAVAQRELPC